jgi:hypothetical protein
MLSKTFLALLEPPLLMHPFSSGYGSIRSSLTKNERKKVRGVCDGSTRSGNTMVHGVTYAPTPQQIYVLLQISLSAFLGMYL